MPSNSRLPSPTRVLAVLSLCALAAGARADGVADLKAALARLGASTPLKATIDVRTLDRHGDGKDADEKAGRASIAVDDNAHGLQVSYARELVARLESEARDQARDPKSKTPTRWALEKLDATDLQPMLSAAPSLARRLEDAVLKSERAEPWQGHPARLLSFTIPDRHLTESQRKYVKSYEGTIDVWIAADGTPLASVEREVVSGRAFVVISFDATQQEDCTYTVVGDRLVALRSEAHNVSRGAGEQGDQRIVKTLQPQG